MDAWLRERSLRRRVRTAVLAALTGRTPAADRIYFGRPTPFSEAGGEVAFPALAIYTPSETDAVRSTIRKMSMRVAIECWVSAPRDVADALKVSAAMEDALDDLVDSVKQALFEDQALRALCGGEVRLSIVHGVEPEVVARRKLAAGVALEIEQKTTFESRAHVGPLASLTPLETVHISEDFIGPRGTAADTEDGPDGVVETTSLTTLET